MGGHINDMVSQHWNTPQEIVDAVNNVFVGRIDLDPCDNEFSITNARVSYKLPDHSGLAIDWTTAADTLGKESINVFCNPPFGRSEDGSSIADWVEKAYTTYAFNPKINEVILLLPASTETTFWHSFIWPFADAICFIRGRVKFSLEGKESGASTKGTAIIYYGGRKFEFATAFQSLGKVVFI